MEQGFDNVAELLMEDSWFTKEVFQMKMNVSDNLGLPLFDEIKDRLESRESSDIDCQLSLDDDCQNNYCCESCPFGKKYTYTEYHFIDSSSAEKCKEQINILEYFHII